MTQIKNITIAKPHLKINDETRKRIQEETQQESQVTVHCTFTSKGLGERIRIWDSTFLICSETGHKSKLLYSENISLYPVWMDVVFGATVSFTLVFSGLPKSCGEFDLVEDIPEPGGFAEYGIKRNSSDVYYVEWS